MRAILRPRASSSTSRTVKFKASLTVSKRFGKDEISRYERRYRVNRDDIAFVACRACVSVFVIRGEKKGGGERKKNDGWITHDPSSCGRVHYLRSSQ